MKEIKDKNLWQEKIPYIKTLKEFFSKIEYQEINLWPIIANDVYTYYRNQDRKLLERLKLIIRFIFFRENLEIIKDKRKILASYFMQRSDHHELMKSVINAFPKEEIFFLDAYEHKNKPLKKYKFSIPNLILLFKIWLKFKRNNLKKILGKYYRLFITRTYQRYKQIDYFKKFINELKPKGYIAFCSSVSGEETILTLFCKKKNIPSFTLQHGLLSSSSFRDFNPVIIQMENNVSDYLLLWGKSSYKLFQDYNIDKSKLLIVGNPKYIYSNNPPKKFLPKEATVFFSVTSNEKSNEEMLSIINDFSLEHPEVKFNLKLHPFDKAEKYDKGISSNNLNFVDKNVSVGELLEKSDFIIVHNSSVTYEALFYKIPILRFKDKFFINFWNNPDTFSNLKELEKLFQGLKNKNILKRFMKFYDKELKGTFYFHPKKSVSRIYYEKIIEKINKQEKILNKL